MAIHDQLLSILSYNMHGFNQGEAFLTDACLSNNYDIIFIQEHWLSSDNLNKLSNINSEYIVFGNSAMSKSTASDVLYGRPFGGTASLVRRCLVSNCRKMFIGERVVALSICNSLFVNMYLPCDDGTVTSNDIVIETLAVIADLLNQHDYDYIFIGGDLNVNLNSGRKNTILIKSFLLDFDLHFLNLIDLNANSNSCYTFSNDKRDCSSEIDFICFSNTLLSNVKAYKTVCEYNNCSDHEPLHLLLSLPGSSKFSSSLLGLRTGVSSDNVSNTNQRSTDINEHSTGTQLRFDHGNIAGYYDYTRVLLQPVLNELHETVSGFNRSYDTMINTNNYQMQILIERWYNKVVSSLICASDIFIPRLKCGVLKNWWDIELEELKSKAILSHRRWVDCGKPRNGDIFNERTRDKFVYKSLIQKRKLQEKETISNELHDCLLQKNSNAFWKTWKRKVCVSDKKIPCIDGCYDDTLNCNKFRLFFEKVCTVNSVEHDESMTRLLGQRLSNHAINHCAYIDNVNAELIGLALCKLHSGKVPGYDRLQSEHLSHAHPVLLVLLSKLFCLMLKYGYVPDSFGKGLLIPIPKDSNTRGSMTVDSFRGITISPVISKLFEHCLLMLYSDSLYSSDRQFGFKKGLSCTHAIYTVRKVIEYFVDNGSTVNMCCLDISKAFDRVNSKGLLLKLLERRASIYFVKVLHNWFEKSFCAIKWNNILSEPFKILAGIRQGGILSPVLFSIYVDNILVKLRKLSCFMFGINFGSLMYADDLVLLAPSVTELQAMLDIVCDELNDIDLLLNEKKSVCIRFGQRWHQTCSPLLTKRGSIQWSKSVTYLGVNLLAGGKFCCDVHIPKSKFYASFNSIYSKLGKINNPIVTLNLVSSMSLPSLLYAVEALSLNSAFLRAVEHPWSRVFMKVFSTFDAGTVLMCQYYTGFLPVQHLARIRQFKFLDSLKSNSNLLVREIYRLFALDELRKIAEAYNANIDSVCNKNFITNWFKSSIVNTL